jgi:hypothetical protein
MHEEETGYGCKYGVGGGRPVLQQREGTGPISCLQPLFVTSIGMETEPRTLSTNQRGVGNCLSAYTATLYIHHIYQIAALSLRTLRP